MRIGQFVEYKGYTGSIDYDPEVKEYYGTILNVKDYADYCATDVVALERVFHETVDEYISFRRELGIEMFK